LKPARPILERLADTAGETAVLGVVREGRVVALDAAECRHIVRVVPRIGEPAPLHCTAMGKVALAFGDHVLRESLPEPLPGFTEHTQTSKEKLFAELERVAELGYAMERSEFVSDVTTVATPVRDYTGLLVAALALTGPTHRMDERRLRDQIIPSLTSATRQLSGRLGFEPKK
jgi:DNA-binding IclR family transcriptional regulator